MKKIFFLIIPIIAAICALPLVKQAINDKDAGKLIAKEPPPHIMCYEIAAPNIKEPTLADLKDQLSTLENLYKNKKIDKTAYQTRKTDLLNQIKAYK